MKKQSLRILLLIAAAVWLSAVGFASVYDLQISLSVADEGSIFGRILEIFGEPPAILFTSFNFSLIFSHFWRHPERKRRHIVFSILALVGSAGTVFYTAGATADYFLDWLGGNEKAATVAVVFTSAAVSMLLIFASLKMSRKTVERFYRAAGRAALAGVLTFAIIWAFKLCWGRVRFRQLEDISQFTSWYLPQGFTGYFSFPSGHTANATVISACIYYFEFIPKRFEKIKPLFCAVIAVWIPLVAISRVLVGAHYLSDVLFGGAITAAIVYFSRPKN